VSSNIVQKTYPTLLNNSLNSSDLRNKLGKLLTNRRYDLTTLLIARYTSNFMLGIFVQSFEHSALHKNLALNCPYANTRYVLVCF